MLHKAGLQIYGPTGEVRDTQVEEGKAEGKRKKKRKPEASGGTELSQEEAGQVQTLFAKFPVNQCIAKVGWLSDWIHHVRPSRLQRLPY